MGEQATPFTVMVVENDPVFREIVTGILAEEGCEVLAAADGLTALELLERHTPEIFLVDLIMPGIGGEKLCRIIRSNPRFEPLPAGHALGRCGRE
ncbi:MAG: response regulator [Thermodesulfobacteriota bacterium]